MPLSDTLEYFVSGGFGGICTVLVGHPFDTIKVRLQTMPVPKESEPPLYKGTLDCVKQIFLREGVTGFYKGIGPPLIGIAPIFAISFMGFQLGQTLLSTGKWLYFDYLKAGAFSGIFTTIIMAPGERIKCLLQIQNDDKTVKYKGTLDCAIQLYKEGGVRSIYKGTGATLLRDIPAAGLYFATYEIVKDYCTNFGQKPNTIYTTVFAGGSAGVTHWLIGMPFDVLKSRLQTAPEGTYKNGLRDVFKAMMINEGPLALYTGIVPVLIRSFPANAACFLGFEFFRQLIAYFKKNIV